MNTEAKKKENGVFMNQIDVKELQPKPRIYLVRNGESCERLMSAWTHKAFRNIDTYSLLDLNQPFTVVKKINSTVEVADLFKNDAPLTRLGKVAARSTGRAFSQRNLSFHAVYSSPALRCVETAAIILSETRAKDRPKICVEPALLDPNVFYLKDEVSLPKFLSPEALLQNGYDIDVKYNPMCYMEDIRERTERSVFQFLSRVTPFASFIRRGTSCSNCGTLVVSHAPTIDIIARTILGRNDLPSSRYDLYRMGLYYPFSSVTTLEEEKAKDKEVIWTLKKLTIPAITYGHINSVPHMPIF